MGKRAPKIFCVNQFRKDDNNRFLWPGFEDNLRVPEWVLDRCEGRVGAQKVPIGNIPVKRLKRTLPRSIIRKPNVLRCLERG